MKQSKEVNGTRFIRIREVIRLTGISKSYIYQLCNDNQFPKSIQLIPGGKSVAWLESEVIDWIDSRVKARDEVA
jgi:prophage regulatory protein